MVCGVCVRHAHKSHTRTRAHPNTLAFIHKKHTLETYVILAQKSVLQKHLSEHAHVLKRAYVCTHAKQTTT